MRPSGVERGGSQGEAVRLRVTATVRLLRDKWTPTLEMDQVELKALSG